MRRRGSRRYRNAYTLIDTRRASRAASRAGEVVSIGELITAVWQGVVVGDGSAYLAIKHLRHALTVPGDDTVYIQTIPKRGYRLTVPVEPLISDGDDAADVGSATPEASAPEPAASGSSASDLPTAPAVLPRRSPLPWLIAACLVLTLGVVLVSATRYFTRPPATPTQQLRFQISASGYVAGIAGLAISPDGTQVAYTAASDGVRQIWLRPLSVLTARPLPGTENAVSLFWSRDSRELAFHADDKLKKINVATGIVLTLADTLSNPPGTWTRDGTILYSNRSDGSVAVAHLPAAGGAATQVTQPEDPEYTHIRPQILADNDHFLYVGLRTIGPVASLYVGSLAEPDRAPAAIGNWDEADILDMTYIDGFLLRTRGTTLVAEPFDDDTLALLGDAKVIAENVGDFAVSSTGVLVYRESSEVQAAGESTRRLAWYDRSGRRLGEVEAPPAYRLPRLSPDGRRIAVTAPLPGTVGPEDVWVIDAERGRARRVTYDDAYEGSAVWSPNGAQLAYNSSRGGGLVGQIYRRAANGMGPEELLFTGEDDEFAVPADWSRDGQYLVFTRTRVANILTRTDIWVVPTAGDEPAFPLIESPFRKGYPQLSPNGRWIAYGTNESGVPQIVVQPFPNVGEDKQYVSTQGGFQALWREDGLELFYLTAEGVLTAVDVETDDGEFRAGTPRALFTVDVDLARDRASPNYHYDVADNGQRFLFNEALTQGSTAIEPDSSRAEPVPLNVIVNWTAGLD